MPRYASSLVAPLAGQLTGLAQQLDTLLGAFHSDADGLVNQADALSDYFQGQGASAFVGTVGQYRQLTHDSLATFEQLRNALRRCASSMEDAANTMDSWASGDYEGLGDLVALVFTRYLSFDDVLQSGDSAMSSAIAEAQSALRQQQHHDPYPGPDPFSYSDITGSMYTWAADVQNANKALQGVIAEITPNGEVFIPSLQGVMVDAKVVGGITGELSAIGLSQGIVASGNPEVGVTPQEYQDVLSVYPDPQIQRYLFLLLSTPTGAKFARYLLYMGKQVGSGFLTMAHLGTGEKAPGAVTTYGGYIELNVDVLSDDPTEARYLVHEGLESYYKVGMGIREMGTQHADYVADWFAGKFLSELSATGQFQISDFGSYGQVFSGPNGSGWINGPGSWYRDVAKEPVNTNIHNIDQRGWVWKDWEIDLGPIHINEAHVDNPPNPGLTPQMLTVNDMSTLDPIP